MPHVMICGPDYIETCDSIAHAFESHGWTSSLFEWHIDPPGFLSRTINKMSRTYNRHTNLSNVFNKVLRESLIPATKVERPELILIVKPHMIDQANLNVMPSLDIPVITWSTDSFSRFPGQQSLVDISKITYVQDGRDRVAKTVHWLPLGFDERIYCPTEQSKNVDILFVGNIYRRDYGKRLYYFNLLRKSSICRKYSAAFIGSSPSTIRNYLSYLSGNVKWISKCLPLRDYARMIARSRICINIHQDDGLQPINPLFFAISACKSCQVAEARNYLYEWMCPGRDFIAVDETSFLATLQDLLESENTIQRITTDGYKSAMNHSYFCRVKQIIDDFECLF
ncbi:glycosyltransferase [Acidobacteriota bacterium]